jgi:hypothetical protein
LCFVHAGNASPQGVTCLRQFCDESGTAGTVQAAPGWARATMIWASLASAFATGTRA